MTFGVCDEPEAEIVPVPGGADSSFAHLDVRLVHLRWLLGVILVVFSLSI